MAESTGLYFQFHEGGLKCNIYVEDGKQKFDYDGHTYEFEDEVNCEDPSWKETGDNKGAVKKKTKGTIVSCNKANIADPGFYFIFNFAKCNPPEKVTSVDAQIFIGMPHHGEGSEHREENQHHVTYTMYGGGTLELDLSKPMRVLIPFIDIHWAKGEHYDWDLKYRVEIRYNIETKENPLETVDHVLEGDLEKESTAQGPFIIGYFQEHLPKGKPWHFEEDGLMIKDIIYTKEGVWFRIHYLDARSTATYLMGEGGSSTNFAPMPTNSTGDRVDPFESCFLPYPRIKNGTQPIKNCYIRVQYQGKNFEFHPPQGFDTYDHPFVIMGHDKAPGAPIQEKEESGAAADLSEAVSHINEKPPKSAESRSVFDEPQTSSWFKRLIQKILRFLGIRKEDERIS
ncbi:MAG: hypothetical protein AAF587_22400 [Bacteroidota bacterium]